MFFLEKPEKYYPQHLLNILLESPDIKEHKIKNSLSAPIHLQSLYKKMKVK